MQAVKTDAFPLPPWRRVSARLRDPACLRSAALWVLFAAFVLRACWAVSVPVVPLSDSNAYDVFAQNIAAGHCFCWRPGEPTAYWAVGTAALYAAIYGVFGHSYTAIAVLNILLGLGTVALGMSLARRWLGPVAAVLTGAILALWPLMIEFTTILASEMLFNFCVLAAFWLAGLPGWTWPARALASGVALAASAYIRPVALLLAPLAFLQEALIQRRPGRALAACALACVVMVALILPWSLRNLQVFDRFVLVSTNAGANFWMGNNPDTNGGYMPLPETGIVNEAELDRHLNRKAWEYIRQEPIAFVARSLKKAVLLHDRESIGVAWNEEGLERSFGRGVLMPLKIVSLAYWWLMLAGAAYGLVLLSRQRPWLEFLSLPPLTIWAYYTAVHGITVTGERNYVPSDPFIAMLAAYALGALLARLVSASQA